MLHVLVDEDHVSVRVGDHEAGWSTRGVSGRVLVALDAEIPQLVAEHSNIREVLRRLTEAHPCLLYTSDAADEGVEV